MLRRYRDDIERQFHDGGRQFLSSFTSYMIAHLDLGVLRHYATSYDIMWLFCISVISVKITRCVAGVSSSFPCCIFPWYMIPFFHHDIKTTSGRHWTAFTRHWTTHFFIWTLQLSYGGAPANLFNTAIWYSAMLIIILQIQTKGGCCTTPKTKMELSTTEKVEGSSILL